MRSSTTADIHIGEDDEATAALYDYAGAVRLRHATLFLYGATEQETERVSDAINAAITNAKARSRAARSEHIELVQAAE